jgi:glutathione S-transferase
LFGNRQSGHSWKVRQALVLLGIEHEYVHVDIGVPRKGRHPDFVSLSPFGEVPLLVIDERVYAQSNAILLELCRRSGRLGDPDIAAVERWLFWEANRIGFSAANLRWQMRFEAVPMQEVIDTLRERAETDLSTLQLRLSGSSFVLGTVPTVVDIACSAYLHFTDEIGLNLDRWPAVRDWLGALAQVPGWEHPYSLMDESRLYARTHRESGSFRNDPGRGQRPASNRVRSSLSPGNADLSPSARPPIRGANAVGSKRRK